MNDRVTIVSAADSHYFDLLKGLISSIRHKPQGKDITISILDVGLAAEQSEWIKQQGGQVKEPGWDFDIPKSMVPPGHFRALLARPFIPEYFPGFDTYLHIDADAWVQDWSAIQIYFDAAAKGFVAITPQIDRAYITNFKRPKRLGRTQNFKSFRWSYGWRLADRLGRNPILNCGVFAMPANCRHWNLWSQAIEHALKRRTIVRRRGWPNLHFKLVEQTAMNYVIFHDKAPATFLPASCNWFCALAAPMFDENTGMLVEPHAPNRPIGVVHLAGEDFQNRSFTLETTQGDRISSRLRFEDINELHKAD